jgi:type II secretory pathway pseudopilin PulG
MSTAILPNLGGPDLIIILVIIAFLAAPGDRNFNRASDKSAEEQASAVAQRQFLTKLRGEERGQSVNLDISCRATASVAATRHVLVGE